MRNIGLVIGSGLVLVVFVLMGIANTGTYCTFAFFLGIVVATILDD